MGSFIDAETQIKKQKEIRNGVLSKTKIIKKDVRDYSQGSIKYFEILNIQKNTFDYKNWRGIRNKTSWKAGNPRRYFCVWVRME